MKQCLFFFTILSILLSSGCQKDEPNTQYDIETDFHIDMIENLSPTGSSLVFQMSTVADQNCLNVGIACRFSPSPTQLGLSIVQLVEPAICEEGNAPAQANVSTGDLAIRNHSFEIDLRSEVFSEGNLNVNSDRIIASFINQNGFEFLHTILLRVPRYTIWGYVNFIEEQNLDSATDFITQLKALGSEVEYEKGYYGHFSIDENNTASLKDLPSEGTNLTFSLSYEGADNDLQSFIDDFRITYPNLEIILKDWKGASF